MQRRHRVLSTLTQHQIESGNPTWCRRWLRMCGVIPEQGERVRDLRARVEELRDTAARGEQVPVIGAVNPLPWQLSKRAKSIVNERVVRTITPHLTPKCSIDKSSFIYRQGCWRTASKLQALLVILVPALRGFVRPLRTALRSLILGLRLLEGQTFSVNDLRRLGLRQGFHALAKRDITCAKKMILEGLSMLEGCCPVRKLVPATHCLVHYADGAALHGILKLYWMMSFGMSIIHTATHTSPHTTHHTHTFQSVSTRNARI